MGRSRTLTGLVAASAFVLLAGGCSKDPAPAVTASTSEAEALVRSLFKGRAQVQLTGDIELTARWGFKRASLSSDATVIAWGDGTDFFDILAMPGAIASGSHPTSLDVWLDLLLRSRHRTFISERGECDLVITLETDSMSGRASCEELTSEDGRKTIGMVVTFSASGGG